MVFFTLKILRLVVRLVLLPFRLAARAVTAVVWSTAGDDGDQGAVDPVSDPGPGSGPGDVAGAAGDGRTAATTGVQGSTRTAPETTRTPPVTDRSWFAVGVGVLGGLTLLGGLSGNGGLLLVGAAGLALAYAVDQGSDLAWKVAVGVVAFQLIVGSLFALVAATDGTLTGGQVVLVLLVTVGVYGGLLVLGLRERGYAGPAAALAPSPFDWTERLVVALGVVVALWLLRTLEYPLLDAASSRGFTVPMDPTWLFFSSEIEATGLFALTVGVPLVAVALLDRRPDAGRLLAGAYFAWILVGYTWLFSRPGDLLELLTIPIDSPDVHVYAYLNWLDTFAALTAVVGLVAVVNSKDEGDLSLDAVEPPPLALAVGGYAVSAFVSVAATVESGSAPLGLVVGGTLAAATTVGFRTVGGGVSGRPSTTAGSAGSGSLARTVAAAGATSDGGSAGGAAPVGSTGAGTAGRSGDPSDGDATADAASSEATATGDGSAASGGASAAGASGSEASVEEDAVDDATARDGATAGSETNDAAPADGSTAGVGDGPLDVGWRREADATGVVCGAGAAVAVEADGVSRIADGGVDWRYAVDGTVAGADADGAAVVVATTDGLVEAVEDGESRWALPYRTGGPISTPPAVDDLAFVLDGAGRLHALTVDAGRSAWTCDVDGAVALGADGARALVATHDAVVAVEEGGVAWRTTCPRPTTPPVADGEGVVVGTASGLARLSADGLDWTAPVGSVEGVDGVEGTWHVLTADAVSAVSEGAVEWRVAATPTAGPSTLPDGTALIGLEGGAVVADRGRLLGVFDGATVSDVSAGPEAVFLVAEGDVLSLG